MSLFNLNSDESEDEVVEVDASTVTTSSLTQLAAAASALATGDSSFSLPAITPTATPLVPPKKRRFEGWSRGTVEQLHDWGVENPEWIADPLVQREVVPTDFFNPEPFDVAKKKKKSRSGPSGKRKSKVAASSSLRVPPRRIGPRPSLPNAPMLAPLLVRFKLQGGHGIIGFNHTAATEAASSWTPQAQPASRPLAPPLPQSAPPPLPPPAPIQPVQLMPPLQEVAVLATAIADALPLHTPYSRARGADGAGVGLPEASAVLLSHPSSPDDVEDEESAFGQLSAHLAAPPAAPPLDTSALWPSVHEVMGRLRLDQYAETLFELGYDDVTYMAGLPTSRLATIASAAEMKPGHAAKFVDTFHASVSRAM